MNKKPTLDELLRQLPVEKPGPGFTEKLMARIESMPQRQAHRLKPWGIVALCGGSIILAGAVLWGGAYFFNWPVADVFATGKTTLDSFAQSLSATFTKLTDFKLPPVVWNGLLSGTLLLLIDALVRKHKRNRKQPEHEYI